ncbi:MAG: hypothetical protein JW787_06625 [Sedimentisphaerales bacterium]|nr:hypothetical protein [Sedimentisphaerales bacterium]
MSLKNLKILFCFTIAFFEILPFSAAAGAQDIKFNSGINVGTIQTDLIQEASGIIASRKNESVLWVHNDSGNSAKLYAINPAGELLGVFIIKDARCRDWEDIAIGPGPDKNSDYLYIGDIGDNAGEYPSITVYCIPEPIIDSNSYDIEIETEPAAAIELVYPDKPQDAETLLVDPLNRDIYIISKRDLFSRVYCAPYPQSTDKPAKMVLMAMLPWGLAVGGDVSPDGRLVIVRGLTSASIWRRPEGEPLWRAFIQEYSTIELMPEPQGEAICFDTNNLGFFTVSEKPHQPIYYYPSLDSLKDSLK